ncbi:uncharacterized protein J4E84_006191 [Alternaria hordeiaustralica]|uniref:uncharacterized protein n=1 Tax=Alternaria hordeiaustralica TaxID=1187925 RepID=UPI0020C2222C|nr:uncharacterized protein J4E84_006191 [Alternaria hordeiaustralica]KAI4685463.1 hypothetical protein J4E84_006191 [Alternaria hordeiaustralica]
MSIRHRAAAAAETPDDLPDVRVTSESSTTSRIGQSTMDTGLRRLCQSTQSVGLDDQVATGVSEEEEPDMLRLSADPEKLAIAEDNAENSPLLRLPAEIRNTIYDLVLSSHRDFHTFDVARQKSMRQNGGSEITIQQLALLQVCRQLYTETNLIALNSTPFAFGSVTDFSKYIAQTLLPRQISAIAVLKCPFREIYFPGFGVNSAFIGLLRESLRGLKVLVLFGVRSKAVEEEAMRVIERKIAREIKEGCEELKVKVELTRNGLKWRKEVASVYGRGERSLGAE